jgi:predicted O-methyltransferase YrrM
MAQAYAADGWERYVMRWRDPHRRLEPLQREIAVVDEALATLVNAGVLPHSRYDGAKMLAHRESVRSTFDIPWTAISPRMQRLLYAINAIAEPRVMVAVGIYCGNTYISNAGAALGPGACYEAERLVGIEIQPRDAERARRNVAALVGAHPAAEILAADGIPWLNQHHGTIHLLYLDADGPSGSGKSIYLDLLQAGEHALVPGSLVLAHNSVNSAHTMVDYLSYVRDASRFRESVNVIVDDQGLEVSVR